MNDFDKQFDKYFGVKDSFRIASQQKDRRKSFDNRCQVPSVRRLSEAQLDFCRFTSLDTYIRNKSPRWELIVSLKVTGNLISVEDVRRPDFSVLKRYKSGSKSNLKIVDGLIPILGISSRLHGYSGDGYYKIKWMFSNVNQENECEIKINTSAPIVKMSQEDIIECLYTAATNMQAGSAMQLSALHDTLDKQLAEAGEDIFVYELLQNANDYPLTEVVDVEFRLFRFKDKNRRGYLSFSHTGAPFTARNVAAICSANDQDKSDNVKAIGYKGIGFKTVFRYNDRAEIRSGGFGFAFDKKTSSERDGFPWRTIPRKVDPRMTEDYKVQIKLFPANQEKLSSGEGGYSRLLKDLFKDERPLLFIPRIGKIKLYLDDWDCPIEISANSGNWCRSTQLTECVSDDIRKKIDLALKDSEHCRIPPKYRHMVETAVSFACRRDGRRLIPEERACLYCYLPAKDSDWGFRFLMNTDMIPNGKRTDIEYTIDENKYFARVAGKKLLVWIRELINSNEYDYDSIFDLIPDFEQCCKNRTTKVVEFIREFQAGFEADISSLMIPDSHGAFVPISEVWYDETGVVSHFGDSFWHRLKHVGYAPHRQLVESDSYNSFIRRYRTQLGINVFDWDKLRIECVSSEELKNWMKNPMSGLVEFLINKNVLDRFIDLPIFLDNRGELSCLEDLHVYDDTIKSIQQYLPEFVNLTRFLSPKVGYQSCLPRDKFKIYGPATFIKKEMFAPSVFFKSLSLLKDFEVSKRFWAYVAHYRMSDGRERFEGSYDLLANLPFFDEQGNVVEAFDNVEYSVYVKDKSADAELVNAEWYNLKWVKVLNPEYFKGEDGAKLFEFFTSNVFKGSKSLAHKFTLCECYSHLAVKFTPKILARMLNLRSDLGFYQYLNRCYGGAWLDKNDFRQRFSNIPVVDWQGNLIERNGERLFFYDENLIPWKTGGWISENWRLMVNEKYSSFELMLTELGIEKYDDENFGFWFKKVFGACLVLDSITKITSFHYYMQGRISKLSSDQCGYLKAAPIIVWSPGGAQKYEGAKHNVYVIESSGLNVDFADVAKELPDGKWIVARELADLSCEYLSLLGCKIRRDEDVVMDKIALYLARQDGNCITADIHYEFMRFVSKQELERDELKAIKLYGADGRMLYAPTELYLGSRYDPACDFMAYGIEKCFIADQYVEEGVDKEFLLKLGVKENFEAEDVCSLEQIKFCEYFWKSCYPTWSDEKKAVAKKWFRKDVKCILDRSGEVRRPDELYSPSIASYVSAIKDGDRLLPSESMPTDLGFSNSLRLEHCLEYLLTNPAYKMRGEVLKWIADSAWGHDCDVAVSRYRDDPRALWVNGKGEGAQIKMLVGIRHENSKKARVFINDSAVVSFRGLGVNKECVTKAELEEGFTRLGMTLIDDAGLQEETIPTNNSNQKIAHDALLWLYVFLVCRGDEEYLPKFKEISEKVKAWNYVECDSISVSYDEILRSDHRKFYEDTERRIVYFVGNWQSKHVFGDMVAFLKQVTGLKGYPDDDLKFAFDTDGGVAALIERIIDERPDVVSDDEFRRAAAEIDSAFVGLLNEQVASASSGGLPLQIEETPSQTTVSESPAAVIVEPESPPEPQKNFTEEEAEQMQRIFGNELTIDQMNDENRLVCIRLFNSLVAQGYEPKMVEGVPVDGEGGFIKDVYNNQRTRRASTIETNDGHQIHVISARKGVAYVPPLWWGRLAEDVGKYIICAVLSHHEDGFKYIRNRDELKGAVGGRYAVIRIHAESDDVTFEKATEMLGAVSMPPYSTYALLSMRRNNPIAAVFNQTDDEKFDFQNNEL